MSSYVHLFLRVEDQFIPFYTALASSTLGIHLSELAVYEKVNKISASRVANIINEIQEEINDNNQQLDLLNKEKNDLKDFNNSISEKLEGLKNYHQEINEINEDIRFLAAAKSIFYFISDMIEELAEGGGQCALYIGYETGTNVSLNDVIKN